MKKRTSALIVEISVHDLEPPPEPCRTMAGSSLHLLGDIGRIGETVGAEYLCSHPVVAIRIGRKKLQVVGQFRSYELALRLNRLHPLKYSNATVLLLNYGKDEAAGLAMRSLFMEGLVSSLAPEFASTSLGMIWTEFDPVERICMLPSVTTQADFSNAFGYDSRSSFDPRHLNRLPRLKGEMTSQPDDQENSDEITENDQ